MSEDDRSVCNDSDGEQGAPSAKRRRGKAQKWSKVQNFDDTTSFNAWLEGKQGTDWLVKGPKQKTCLGSKQYYKCRYAQKTGYQGCDYKICALFCRTSESVEVSWNGRDHSHEKTGDRGEDIEKTVMDHRATLVVKKALEEGKKPMEIRRSLRAEEFVVPTKRQLWNAIAYIRRKNESSTTDFTTSKLATWID